MLRNIAITFPPTLCMQTIPVSQKTVYQRPYLTRSQRRAAARRKSDENTDYKFLLKVASGIALLVVLAVGFAIGGMAERDNATAKYPRSAK